SALPAGSGGRRVSGQQPAYAPAPTPAPYGGTPPTGAGGFNTGAAVCIIPAAAVVINTAAALGTTQPHVAPTGGGALKFIVAGVLALCVAGGVGVGVLIFAFSGSGDPDPTTAPPPTGVTIGPVMRPVDPQVPTTPTSPTTPTPPPTVPPPTTLPTTPPATTTTPPRTPPTTTTAPPRDTERRVSPADEAMARRLAANGQGALQRGDFVNAIASLQEIQRLTGRSSPQARELRNAISARGSREIGGQLARGNCAGAQDIFRRLRTAGAEREARSQFRDPRWCAAP
ncbi:MAG: hypothetical protein ACK6CU_17830, partial [Deltaproteobacteria bacterium]